MEFKLPTGTIHYYTCSHRACTYVNLDKFNDIYFTTVVLLNALMIISDLFYSRDLYKVT